MPVRASLNLHVLAYLLYALSACNGGERNLPAGSACGDDAKCGAGLACDGGFCRAFCYTDDDCEQQTQHCEGGVCRPGTAYLCGNGRLHGEELCDDGNVYDNDGCSATCLIEDGWVCSGAPSSCTPLCGDGRRLGVEQCDDNNDKDGDGCSSRCEIEPQWTCAGEPSGCMRILTLSPDDLVYTNGTIELAATVRDDTIIAVVFLCDNEVVASVAAPYRYSFDTTALDEGPHSLQAQAVSARGTMYSLISPIVVDRTPPVVIEQRPAPPRSEQAAFDDVLALVFSEPLRPGFEIAVTSDCATYDPDLSSDGTTLTLGCIDRLSSDEPCGVSVTLTSELKDLAGNGFVESTYSWTIEDWLAVGPAFDVILSGYDLATLESGAPLLVYAEAAPGDTARVKVRRWDGEAWVAVGADLGTNGSYQSPVVDSDPTGKIYVAWIDTFTSPGVINVMATQDGAFTAYPQPITTFEAFGTTYTASPHKLALAVTPAGVPWLAWADGTEDQSLNAGSCAQVFDIGGTQWTLAACEALHYGRDVALSVLDGDTPVFAYDWADESGLVAASLPGYGTSSFSVNPSATGLSPALVTSACGTAIAWRERRDDGWAVRAQLHDGTAWIPMGDAATVVETTYITAPDVAFDRQGRAVVAWGDYERGFFVHRFDNGGWEPMSAQLGSLPFGDPVLKNSPDCQELFIAFHDGGGLRVMRLNQ